MSFMLLLLVVGMISTFMFLWGVASLFQAAGQKKCNMCAETIQKSAKLCKHCGSAQ